MSFEKNVTSVMQPRGQVKPFLFNFGLKAMNFRMLRAHHQTDSLCEHASNTHGGMYIPTAARKTSADMVLRPYGRH